MRAYSSMPASEFVYQLRTIAINAKAHPLVLDQIDAVIDSPTEDEIEAQIEEAVDEAEKRCFEEGKLLGENNKDSAVEDAEAAMYDACVAAIEAKGAEIGLTEEQIYKVVNHVLWDVGPRPTNPATRSSASVAPNAAPGRG